MPRPPVLRDASELSAYGHAMRHDVSASFLTSVRSPSVFALGQTLSAVAWSPYSIWNTGLPAATKGVSVEHSLYLKHSSFTEKSNDGASCETWSTSFLSPTARPRACAASARNRLNSSWVAAVSGKPVPFV